MCFRARPRCFYLSEPRIPVMAGRRPVSARLDFSRLGHGNGAEAAKAAHGNACRTPDDSRVRTRPVPGRHARRQPHTYSAGAQPPRQTTAACVLGRCPAAVCVPTMAVCTDDVYVGESQLVEESELTSN